MVGSSWSARFKQITTTSGGDLYPIAHKKSNITESFVNNGARNVIVTNDVATSTTNSVLTWSYGSGNYNRPLSRKCKFFIKY